MLLPHQVKFARGYKDKDIIAHEGGSGKTVCGSVWLHDGRDADALVICPKKVKRKWGIELAKWQTKAEVISKEEFMDWTFRKPSAIIVDEGDEFASPLFIASLRSARSARLYEFVKLYPDVPILILSATPVRSTPWNLHTLLCFVGIYVDWKKWRSEFFELKFLPYLPRPAYFPKDDWRDRVRKVLEKNADIVLLRECTELPENPEPQYINVKTPKYSKDPHDKPFFDEHRWEQKNKAKAILEFSRDYRKVLVVAYYRKQIMELKKALGKDRETFAIFGGIDDQEAIIEAATKSDECFLICQASLGAGFDADTFSAVIFASMSYAVRDYVQMKFRVRRIHNLHPVQYAYLIAGRCDKAVLENVEKGKDFIPSEWKQ